MQRFLLLLLCFAGSASAQFGNTGTVGTAPTPIGGTGCALTSYNPNTKVGYLPGCLAPADVDAPILDEIDQINAGDNRPTYQLYAHTLGSHPPSICVGNAEPYSPITNSFLDPATLPPNAQVLWVYVCQLATLHSSWNPQSGAIAITLQTPLTMNMNTAVPAQYQVPMVMLTNNDTGKASVSFYYTAPTVYQGVAPSMVTGVTSLGIYPGSGLPRYQINGANFGNTPPTVQLLTAQSITRDAMGTVLTETPVASTASLQNAQGTLVCRCR